MTRDAQPDDTSEAQVIAEIRERIPDGASAYESLSDAELIADLRERLPDRSWTMAQFIELERRGFDSIATDEELHAAATEDYAAFAERMEAAFAPMADRIMELSGLQEGARALSERLTSKFNIPQFTGPKPLKVPSLAADLDSFDAWDDLPANLAVDRARDDVEHEVEREERALELQVNLLKAMEGVWEEARRENQRDWVDWALVTFAFSAAVAAIWTLVLTLQD